MAADSIPVSLINEPLPPDNVRVLVQPKARSLHAVLCEALTNTQALLTRMEAGVVVPREQQREIVRLLYVATRHQVEALAAVLGIGPRAARPENPAPGLAKGTVIATRFSLQLC
jgi:hypothetical protein